MENCSLILPSTAFKLAKKQGEKKREKGKDKKQRNTEGKTERIEWILEIKMQREPGRNKDIDKYSDHNFKMDLSMNLNKCLEDLKL